MRTLFFAILMTAPLMTACASTVREQIYRADAAPVQVAQWTKTAPVALPVRSEDGGALTGYYWPG